MSKVVDLIKEGNEMVSWMGDEMDVYALNQIGEALKDDTTVQNLRLVRDWIYCEAIIALFEQTFPFNTTLVSLDLSSNIISDDGATVIAGYMKTNGSLHTISLINNQIGDEGGIALAEGLRENSTLRNLFLTQNLITDQCIKPFESAIGENLERKEGLERLWIKIRLSDGLIEKTRIKREWRKERHMRHPLFFRDQVMTILLMWNHDQYEEGECEGIRWNELPIEVVLRIVKWLGFCDVEWSDWQWKEKRDGKKEEC